MSRNGFKARMASWVAVARKLLSRSKKSAPEYQSPKEVQVFPFYADPFAEGLKRERAASPDRLLFPTFRRSNRDTAVIKSVDVSDRMLSTYARKQRKAKLRRKQHSPLVADYRRRERYWRNISKEFSKMWSDREGSTYQPQ